MKSLTFLSNCISNVIGSKWNSDKISWTIWSFVQFILCHIIIAYPIARSFHNSATHWVYVLLSVMKSIFATLFVILKDTWTFLWNSVSVWQKCKMFDTQCKLNGRSYDSTNFIWISFRSNNIWNVILGEKSHRCQGSPGPLYFEFRTNNFLWRKKCVHL